MKKIKIVSISLFITIFGLTVNAQNKTDRSEEFSKIDGRKGKMDPTEQVDREMERLDKQLTLNDKQKEEVRKILKENEENRKSQLEISDKKEKGKMDSNRKEMDEKIEKILTSEQKTKYSEFKNQKPEHERNDSKGRNKDTSEDRKNRKRENSRES